MVPDRIGSPAVPNRFLFPEVPLPCRSLSGDVESGSSLAAETALCSVGSSWGPSEGASSHYYGTDGVSNAPIFLFGSQPERRDRPISAVELTNS